MEQTKNKQREWKRVWTRLPWLLLIPLGLLIPRLCRGRAAQIETYYASDLYKPIKGLICRITSVVPFSIAEWTLYALIAGSVLALLVCLIRVLAKKAHVARLVSRVLSIAILFGVLLNLFYVTWGLNYFRTPLKARMGLSVQARPVEELADLTLTLAERANALRATLPEDGAGTAALPDGCRKRDMLDALPAAYAALAAENPLFSGYVTRAKSVFWSTGLSWAGITGVYVGITAEPNVNVDIPVYLLPQTAAHEMAHQLGIASEDEAEFASYLACAKSDDPFVRYSGLLSALIRCGNALYGRDPERYAAIRATYGEGLSRDLAADRAYWDAFESEIEEKATQVNDQYLKHNQQESGVDSYGEAVDLLLAYYALTNF